MKQWVKYEAVVFVESAMQPLFSLPRFRIFNRLKSLYLRLMGAEVGKRVVFYPGVWIMPGKGLVLGDDVDLAKDVQLTTRGGVSVGDRTLVGYGTKILSSNHRRVDGRVFGQGHVHKPVHIGADVWIGANVVILPGVAIGDGAVLAAGSIVSRDVPAGHIAAGVPARSRPLD